MLINKRDLFLAILQTINLPYNANGSLKDNSWDSWYQQQYATIDEGK
ncbi:hypothetical protein N627_2264 [Levilactobacillus brevis]|nr:hypothetical protein N627_2264 [Levilactobacillus brevis]